MNKKEFLKALEKELIYHQCEDITSVIEYYDELIEDKKENGAKEKDVIDELSISDIVRNTKVEKKINQAVEKPSLSNNMKALIAFLGILSFPLLVTVGAVLFALTIAAIAIAFSLIVAFGALLFSGVVAIPVLLFRMFVGELPFFSMLFGIGVILILIGIFGLLAKGTLNASKSVMSWFANLMKNRFRKEVNAND